MHSIQSFNPSQIKAILLIIIATLPATAGLALAGPPTQFVSRGPGGGGAFFGPSINPFNSDEMWIGSDMSDLFHSTDFGRTWETVDFRLLGGGSQPGRMEFTSEPLVRYALNSDVPALSADGGVIWTNIPPDPWSQSVYCLYADPLSTNRLLVSDYSTLKISTNSGATYSVCYSNSDLLIAGAVWDGPAIYVGTRPGLVVSTNGGASFTFVGTPGIPASEAIVSFADAKENGTLRFFCVTLGSGDVYPGVQGSDYGTYKRLYKLDGGTGSWTVATNGVAGNHPFFVAMCGTNISIAYAAGSDNAGQPVVLKTVNGGGSWSQVMQCTGNANIATGWTGDDTGGWNWKKWWWGECAMGFTVCATDPNRAVISDFGFVHITTNGGALWQQAYDWQGCENAAGMQYYTKDLAIDPNDSTQATWYAGVWGEWGSSSGLGGLYRTTDRGVTWTRITTNLKAVGSCTVSPVNADEMYVTTEDQGLWYSSNRRAATPAFTKLGGYPFRFPTRVFFNPYDTNEVWVTSFGNGMRLGRVNEPRPVLRSIQRASTTSSVTVAAAPGQRVVLSASPDLRGWTPVGTNVMFTNQCSLGETSSTAVRYFRAEVR